MPDYASSIRPVPTLIKTHGVAPSEIAHGVFQNPVHDSGNNTGSQYRHDEQCDAREFKERAYQGRHGVMKQVNAVAEIAHDARRPDQ